MPSTSRPVGRDAGLLPPRIDVSPTWTFWSQFASLTFSGGTLRTRIVRRQHDALVQRCRQATDDSVFRSFHMMHAVDYLLCTRAYGMSWAPSRRTTHPIDRVSLMLNYGAATPVVMLVAHIAYGAIVGGVTAMSG